MNTHIAKLIREVDELRQSLAAKTAKLERVRYDCSHQWAPTKYVPIHHEAYTIPGDPPGVGGVDHQFPCYVPSRTEDKWSRTCTVCGMEQETQRIKKVPTRGSVPGTKGTEEVPDFHDPRRF